MGRCGVDRPGGGGLALGSRLGDQEGARVEAGRPPGRLLKMSLAHLRLLLEGGDMYLGLEHIMKVEPRGIVGGFDGGRGARESRNYPCASSMTRCE